MRAERGASRRCGLGVAEVMAQAGCGRSATPFSL